MGDSYENALAETIVGLYKAAMIYARGPWWTRDAMEYGTLEWVDWFNNRRLPESIGHVPPAADCGKPRCKTGSGAETMGSSTGSSCQAWRGDWSERRVEVMVQWLV